jgi:opacity protein-like surface antigen
MKNVLLRVLVCSSFISPLAEADESLFGILKGAETLPKNALEVVQHVTRRYDKGQGTYEAIDTKTELEYGITDRATAAVYVLGQSIRTEGLLINGYLPKDESYGLRPSGVEASIKYNFLSPAKDDFGLASYFATSYSWLDPHSGQNKKKLTFELEMLMQKYFIDGEVIWVGNVGMESTMAQRGEIADLPADFEWSTKPEMEIGFKAGTGLSYRFASNWFAGAEVVYETEFETDVGQERRSVQAGPTLHYGSKDWWLSVSYLPQISGGGEKYDGQSDENLHLIEKTKQEIRLKLGFNF